jgi:ADP-ribose pyrophosphatase
MNELKHQFIHTDVKIIRKKKLYSGFCSVNECLLQNKLFSGTWSAPYNREVVNRYDAIGVLPYDPKLDKVVLIEQFRIGAYSPCRQLVENDATPTQPSPWLLEIVAGVIDKDETITELIHREMMEETGLKVAKILPVFEYFSSPGASTEKIQLFCAAVDATLAPKFLGMADENEDIKIHVVTSKEAFAAVNSGKIHNAMAIIALLWLELHLTEVRNNFGV